MLQCFASLSASRSPFGSDPFLTFWAGLQENCQRLFPSISPPRDGERPPLFPLFRTHIYIYSITVSMRKRDRTRGNKAFRIGAINTEELGALFHR